MIMDYKAVTWLCCVALRKERREESRLGIQQECAEGVAILHGI